MEKNVSSGQRHGAESKDSVVESEFDSLTPSQLQADDRPETKDLLQRKSAINESPQVQQLKALQRVANSSGVQQSALQRKASLEASGGGGGNQGGLPDNLRTGMEQLSGMDMSDVRVHRNSSKAAEAGALAYAQGNDIHLGAGQEQHLPHEAWHVVQQRQGRVKPTTQAPNGAAVNDDRSLESEADVMGEKAVQMKADEGNALQKSSSSENGPLQRIAANSVVIQRVVTEITPKTKELENGNVVLEEILSVNIIGRPSGPFSSSMGDHTTAFAVHREGLRMQLVGKTFEEAFKVMNLFYTGIKDLPGWGMVDDLPEKHKQRFDESNEKLIKLLALDASKPDAKVVSSLQLAVNEMLELRELLPLSTMNVSLKTGKAGKGKGEAKNVKILAQVQSGELDDNFLKCNAILNLFDSDSSGIAIAEMNKELKQRIMPGGKSPDGGVEDQISSLVNQHIKSIIMAFPDILVDEKEEDLMRVILVDRLTASVQKALVNELRIIDGMRIHYENYALQYQNQLYDRSTEKELETRKERWKSAKTRKESLELAYFEIMGELPILSKISFFNDTSTEELNKIERPIKKVKPTEDEEKEEQLEIEGNEEKEEQLDAEEVVEKEVRYASLGIQLLFDDDMKIVGIGLEGRTQSPHMGSTMGAHSTAWVVHLDGVKNQVIGSTPQVAIHNVVKNLVKHALKVEQDRGDHFKVSSTHLGLMKSAKVDLLNLAKKGPSKDDTTAMIQLQNLIRTYLTYLNFIPGSTIDKGDTGGKAEGTSRKILMDFEKGGRAFKNGLKNAWNGMLDKGELANKATVLLEKEHDEFMQMAYPKSYDALFKGKYKNQFYESAIDLNESEKKKLEFHNNKKKKDKKRKPWEIE
ncbi:MAG: DUF4157 domain-containing protein [Bacteroidia bacterium]|nr:DUF4157 domain-containing protein [Bacteroidia bacterium]